MEPLTLNLTVHSITKDGDAATLIARNNSTNVEIYQNPAEFDTSLEQGTPITLTVEVPE